ncbi:uracil-DNA glycosylase [Hyphomicrobium sp.]|uniref:uracil-DNA glycosylase n=1 Tax=Hyphomicrobium sp. TaxID=82 RepID=UPI000FAB1FD6|nr:uracil-DNA glycosylase [Hyphomicrobium sp.]RUP00696.1 MAG: uracil-DNA glycosylase [Hyphomicrobium sp.]
MSGTARGTAFTPEAPPKCERCPRLVTYRKKNELDEPQWFNGAVPSFGSAYGRLLIVGLAPGRNGANRTGRPFTGDYAGELLYSTLLKYGFATGEYHARIDDGLALVDCMITNAVRCVPPENKPEPSEISNCRPFFEARLASLRNLEVILALGRIAHDQTLATLGKKKTHFPFAHGARHELGDGCALYDSFHCSRYNTNTGRLTAAMFHSVFDAIRGEVRSKSVADHADEPRGRRSDR